MRRRRVVWADDNRRLAARNDEESRRSDRGCRRLVRIPVPVRHCGLDPQSLYPRHAYDMLTMCGGLRLRLRVKPAMTACYSEVVLFIK
ncbi:MAG: hypothetical protein LBH60_03660 [Prevotellaceae bacterium]|nr:hypothetical protein [Prevotellaceae bacterium]